MLSCLDRAHLTSGCEPESITETNIKLEESHCCQPTCWSLSVWKKWGCSVLEKWQQGTVKAESSVLTCSRDVTYLKGLFIVLLKPSHFAPQKLSLLSSAFNSNYYFLILLWFENVLLVLYDTHVFSNSDKPSWTEKQKCWKMLTSIVLILQFEFLVIKNFHVTTEYLDMQQSVHIIWSTGLFINCVATSLYSFVTQFSFDHF